MFSIYLGASKFEWFGLQILSEIGLKGQLTELDSGVKFFHSWAYWHWLICKLYIQNFIRELKKLRINAPLLV
jgi:hypothetical protein